MIKDIASYIFAVFIAELIVFAAWICGAPAFIMLYPLMVVVIALSVLLLIITICGFIALCEWVGHSITRRIKWTKKK